MLVNRMLLLLLALSLSLFFACKSSTEPEEETSSNFELIQPTVNDVVSAGRGAPITAKTIFDNSGDYFVVSVRSAAHYAIGHVPGAINIPWREIAKPENLAKLPTDQKIAVYCYTGHTGEIATTVLNVLGFDAYNMKFGMMSWTKDASVRVISPYVEGTDAHDFAVETSSNSGGDYELADPNFVSSQNVEEVLRAAADDYVVNDAPTILAQDLFDNLNDGDTSNDPQIVSVRAASAYDIGHIPGAVNIPWKEIGVVDNLKKLDPDEDIVVYCYTGHTGGVATTALNLMGYNAVNLKFGIMSWTKDAAVRVASPFNEGTDANDFAVTVGTNP